jgi:voltage-gated potassium channel
MKSDGDVGQSLETLAGMQDVALPASRPYGIYPYHPLRRAWEFVMFVLCLAILWQLPWEWAFSPKRTFLYILPALIIDLFFLADIFIVLRTGILQYGVIKLDKASIRASIETWRLVIYCLSPWPYYLIAWLIDRDNNTLFLCFTALKILRLLRLYDSVGIIRNTLIYINPVSRMVLLFGAFLTISHYSACVFWYEGYREVPHPSWLIEYKLLSKPKSVQYFHTLYYITTCFLTIGYGDIHPVTFDEMCVALVAQLIGAFFYNFVVSNMVSIVADPSRNSFLTKYQRIYSAFRGRGVSDESMEELLKYYEYVWERDRDRADFYETASKLPDGLQKKLALHLHMDVFTKVTALQGADQDALEKVAMALRPRIFTPGDFLIKAGRVSNRMYFVTAGKVDIMNRSGAVITTFDGLSGFVLGERSVLTGEEEEASAIAETYVDAFELMKEDFDEIVQKHPEIQAQLEKSKVQPQI